jgi:hypothetical protein
MHKFFQQQAHALELLEGNGMNAHTLVLPKEADRGPYKARDFCRNLSVYLTPDIYIDVILRRSPGEERISTWALARVVPLCMTLGRPCTLPDDDGDARRFTLPLKQRVPTCDALSELLPFISTEFSRG